MASGALSVVTFKEKVSEFLAGLLSAYQPPLLIQLERGQVDGLSRKATKALKIRSGFLHQPMDETCCDGTPLLLTDLSKASYQNSAKVLCPGKVHGSDTRFQ